MPRRGGGSGGFRYGSRSSGFGPRSSFTASRPATQSRPMQPQPTYTASRPGMFSGFGSTLATGMAFGAGSQIAHQAIRSIMGPSYTTMYVQQMQPADGSMQQSQHQQPQQQQQQLPCMREVTEFAQCIDKNQSDLSICQNFSNQLKECK